MCWQALLQISGRAHYGGVGILCIKLLFIEDIKIRNILAITKLKGESGVPANGHKTSIRVTTNQRKRVV